MTQEKLKNERLPVDDLDDEIAADKGSGPEQVDGADRDWSIWKKIHWVQGKLTAIPKDAELEVGHGKRVPVLSHNALVGAIRPMLDQAGLVLLSTVTEYEVDIQLVQKANGDTYSAFFHKLRKHFTLVNVDGEDSYEFDGYGTAVTPTDKGYGSAESYCKKYAIRSLFLVETDDDPDVGENVTIAEPRAKPTAAARPQRDYDDDKMYGKPVVIDLQVSDHPAGLDISHEAWVSVMERWSDGKTISVAQIKRLYTIAGNKGWPDQAVADVVKHKLPIESMKEIPMDAYDAVCQIFSSFPPTAREPGEDNEPPFDDVSGY